MPVRKQISCAEVNQQADVVSLVFGPDFSFVCLRYGALLGFSRWLSFFRYRSTMPWRFNSDQAMHQHNLSVYEVSVVDSIVNGVMNCIAGMIHVG